MQKIVEQRVQQNASSYRITKIALFTLLLAVSTSCMSTRSKDKPDPAFEDAALHVSKKHYEIAIQKLGEYKTKFPESKRIPEAELLIADSRFGLTNFEEAIFDYERFVKLRPDHPKAPYAQYRVGESYWKEAPDKVDREQLFTRQAMREWNTLIAEYPKSELVAKARENIKEGYKRLVAHEDFIAKFYCRKKKFHACVFRSEQILARYPKNTEFVAAAKKRLATAYLALAETKRADPTNENNIYLESYTAEQLSKKAQSFSVQ